MNYPHKYKGGRRWTRAEVERGIWVALAEDTPQGLREITRRVFVKFDLEVENALGYLVVGGYGRRRLFPGPLTYDAILCYTMPAGAPLDVIRNRHAVTVREGAKAEVRIKWDGERV